MKLKSENLKKKKLYEKCIKAEIESKTDRIYHNFYWKCTEAGNNIY